MLKAAKAEHLAKQVRQELDGPRNRVVMRQTAEDHREMDLVIWGRGQISRVLFIDK